MSGDLALLLQDLCYCGNNTCCYCNFASKARALQAEVERLRAAGDALAEALDALSHSYCGNEDDADLVDAWQEARRG